MMLSNYSARRINTLLDAVPSPARYLEIGVETGYTFFEVAAAFKTAVDPQFLFDRESHSPNDSLQFFEMTSDAFFSEARRDFKYDLVFLDGLHTWDQTYRDFCNCLLITHDQSIIVLDDIFPCDVFSSNRDQIEALFMRQYMTGDPSVYWHGDTYKVIPLIEAFHPLLDFCTLITDGNPQTIVWRSTDPSQPSAAMIRNPGDLSMASLDYLWFLRNQDGYRPVKERDGLELVLNNLKKQQASHN